MKVERIDYLSIAIFVILLSFFTITFLNNYTPSNQEFLIAVFILTVFLGIVSIFYFGRNRNNLYRVGIFVILIFGICSVFLTPINDISDEYEHLARAEIVSNGEVSTHYVNGIGFKSIEAVNQLGIESNKNLFDTSLWNSKIDYGEYYSDCAFAQNPFYAYLAPAAGILVAKLLDLSTIWMLYLGRIANLLLYTAIIGIAIKKSPVFKGPLLIASIIPLAIFQAGSVSSDCFFNAFAILSIAYFFVLYKSDRIKYKDLGVFYISIVLCGLLKQPYLALSLLIFAVPRTNFIDKKQEIVSKIAVLGVLAIGALWSSYATTQLKYSWRANHFIQYHVNASQQLDFMLSNPQFDVYYIFNVLSQIPLMFSRFFEFSVSEFSYTSNVMATFYFIYIIIISLFYPLKEKLKKLKRLEVAFVAAVVYYGIFLVQYLTWIPVRSAHVILGVSGRYFIPLLVFLPLIFNVSSKVKIDKKQFVKIAFSVAISFVCGMLVLTTVAKF